MCNQYVDIHVDALRYVPESFKTQEMRDKAVDNCPFVFDSIPNWLKTQKICDKGFSEDLFMQRHCLDK